jgi:hypothetical protein
VIVFLLIDLGNLVALDELLTGSDVISLHLAPTTTPADFSGRRRWRA